MDLGTMAVTFAGDASSLTSGSLAAIGSLEMVGAAALGIGAVLIGVGVKSAQMAADYQASMDKVQALTGASNDQMHQFDSGLKQLAMDTGVAPKQLSDGLYNVISAGYQGKDAMKVLALATKDSVIGMTSAAVTTDSLTNVLASFGLGAADANRVNGEMLATVTLGKSTFEQYAQSIVKSASSANQFHESMETMNAAFATMTSSGIRAAQASTDFQQSLKVMDGNIGTVAKSLNKNGIAFDEAKFNAMDYGHKILYLNDALDQANQKHVKITGVTIQAAQAISTIAKHIDTYNSDLKTLSDQQAMAAKTQEAWSITSQGFNVSLDRLKATASVVMIDLGQKLLPIATAGVNLLNNAFQNIGPVVTKISSAFKSVDLSSMSGSFQNIATLLKGEFSKEFKDLSMDAQELGKWFNTSVVPALKAALPGFESLGKTILTTVIPSIIQIRDILFDFQQHALQKLAPILGEVIPPLITFAGILAKDLSVAIQFIAPYVIQATKAIADFAGEIIDRVVPIVQNWINSMMPAVKMFASWWNANWPAMAQVLSGVWNIIVGIVKVAWSLVSGIVLIGLDLLSGNWSAAWTDLKNMLSGIWDGIKSIVQGGLQIIQGYLASSEKTLYAYFVQPFVNAWNTISGIFSSISSGISGLLKTASSVAGGISGVLPHFAGGVSNFGGGWAVVGEQGPELVNLPGGSSVYPLTTGGASIGGSSSVMGGGVTQQVIILELDGQVLAHAQSNTQMRQVRLRAGRRVA